MLCPIPKAFDTTSCTSHNGGCKDRLFGLPLSWFLNCLENKMCRTKVNRMYANWRVSTLRVPQRTTLSPLLILMFINDLIDEVSSVARKRFTRGSRKLYKERGMSSRHLVKTACQNIVSSTFWKIWYKSLTPSVGMRSQLSPQDVVSFLQPQRAKSLVQTTWKM